jgi:hypothetical protein
MTIGLCAVRSNAWAQTLTVVSGTHTLPSPTRSDYEGTTTPVVSVANVGYDCPNNGNGNSGCILQMRVAATGTQTIQVRLVTLSGNVNCARAAAFASSTAWVTLGTTAMTVFSSPDRNQDCAATVEFRTTDISWTTQTSNGASTTNYDRDVIVTAIRE